MKFNKSGTKFSIVTVIVLSSALLSGCFLKKDDDDKPVVVPVQTTFSVGGTVAGLSGTLKLKNNGGDEKTITADGSFTFATVLSANDFYDVTISSEPGSLVCDVANGAGTISSADVSTVTVTCVSKTSTIRTFAAAENAVLQQCSGCHPQYYEKWVESGHGYKMNKVGGTIPTFPFTDVSAMFPAGGRTITYTSTAPATFNYSYDVTNTSYIIGGYGWKGRYFDANGSLQYGAGAQYNFADNSFTAYNNNNADADGKKNYNCGFCHTTGWKGITGNNVNYASGTRKDNLPNMDGDWTFSGVTCQRCHGTLAGGSNISGGAGHNVKLMKADQYDPGNFTTGEGGNSFGLSTSATYSTAANSVCADCHIRSNYINKVDADTGKYLLKHHEQSQELYVGRHGSADSTTTEGNGDMGCVTCHDPHASVKFDSKAKGEGVYKSKVAAGNCAVTCHNANSANSSVNAVKNSKPITVNALYGAAGHTCVDCHMPYIVASAVTITAAGNGVSTLATKVPGVTTLGIPSVGNKRGDLRSHVFALTKGSNASFLTASTTFLDGTASQVKIPVEFSCMTCHGTGGTKGPVDSTAAASQLLSTPVH